MISRPDPSRRTLLVSADPARDGTVYVWSDDGVTWTRAVASRASTVARELSKNNQWRCPYTGRLYRKGVPTPCA